MGWDIDLADNNGTVRVQSHQEGSIIAVGGSDLAEMTVTYNYGRLFYLALDREQGFNWLDGKKAQDTIERLEQAITALGTQRDPDYWKDTPGNAGHLLSVLLSWARQHPNAIFHVS